MADGGRTGESRNVRVRDAYRACEFVGKSTETGTENQPNLRPQVSLRQHKLCGGFGFSEFVHSLAFCDHRVHGRFPEGSKSLFEVRKLLFQTPLGCGTLVVLQKFRTAR